MITAFQRSRNIVFKAALVAALSLLAVASSSFAASADDATTPSADTRIQGEENCLATAIYFEARGESEKGQTAVAEVIVTRARTSGRPKTICGVVYEGARRRTGCQFSFACDRRSDVPRKGAAWTRAKDVAAAMMDAHGERQLVGGATYFHAANMKPRWASHMIRVAQIGSQIFYRPKA
jgi:spore germination cell wall hydrolase CwlJ-like protein